MVAKAEKTIPATETEETPAPIRFGITLLINTVDREMHRLDLGQGTQDAVTQLNVSISQALMRLTPNRNWNIVTADGVGHHFNTDHIVCVKVQLG